MLIDCLPGIQYHPRISYWGPSLPCTFFFVGKKVFTHENSIHLLSTVLQIQAVRVRKKSNILNAILPSSYKASHILSRRHAISKFSTLKKALNRQASSHYKKLDINININIFLLNPHSRTTLTTIIPLNLSRKLKPSISAAFEFPTILLQEWSLFRNFNISTLLQRHFDVETTRPYFHQLVKSTCREPLFFHTLSSHSHDPTQHKLELELDPGTSTLTSLPRSQFPSIARAPHHSVFGRMIYKLQSTSRIQKKISLKVSCYSCTQFTRTIVAFLLQYFLAGAFSKSVRQLSLSLNAIALDALYLTRFPH